MPFRGVARATSATMAATSSAAIGWNRPGEILTRISSAPEAAMGRGKSRNWVGGVVGWGSPRGRDQFLLGDLGAEIAMVRPVGPDDGQRDMVPDARCGLGREKVAAGG